MLRKLRWGVLGAAKIAVTKVIPAMGACQLCEAVAIDSRDPGKARRTAASSGRMTPVPAVGAQKWAAPLRGTAHSGTEKRFSCGGPAALPRPACPSSRSR